MALKSSIQFALFCCLLAGLGPSLFAQATGCLLYTSFYEVAKDYYMHFIPDAEQLMPGVTKDVMDSPDNLWMKGLTKEQIHQQIEYYKKRYNQ